MVLAYKKDNKRIKKSELEKGSTVLLKLMGEALNCNKNIIARVVKSPANKTERFNSAIVVDSNQIENYKDYAAVLTSKSYEDILKQDKEKTFKTLFYNVKNLNQLDEGDIINLEPTGRINILYTKESQDNAILITERCNCFCIMCPQPKVEKEKNRTPMIRKLISLIDKDTRYLGITGGEPTLLGEDFLKIINDCKEKLPNTTLEILSNGIAFEDFEFTKKLALIQHPNLIICISLYGSTDSEHNNITQRESFYKTIQGIYNLALFEQKIEIRTVIHLFTYERLHRLAEFIYHNFPFVFHVTFMGMETINLASKNIEKLWIDPYHYNSELKEAVTYLNRRFINVSIYNHQLCILPKELWQFARKSISSWKNIYLDICNECNIKKDCGGFFSSSLGKHSEYIKPLIEN